MSANLVPCIVIASVFCALLSRTTPVNGESLVVDQDGITVLHATHAQLSDGLEIFTHSPPDPVHRLWVQRWTSTDDLIQWTVSVARDDTYLVRGLISSQFQLAGHFTGECGDTPVQACARAVGASDDSGCVSLDVKFYELPKLHHMQREAFHGLLPLTRGNNLISLRATSQPSFGEMSLSLLAIELVRPETLDSITESANAMRSDTTWMRDAGFGLFLHWNTANTPVRGPRVPFEQAVEAFDVLQFASTVNDSGAGFVVLTAIWNMYHFPAPLESIEKAFPGRACRRDLVGDLARALAVYDIKLILYYHYGKEDKEWFWSRSGWETDRQRFWQHIISVFEETGHRYKELLAGWWVDDGAIGLYPASAPWKALAEAAKTGFNGRVLAYNSWALPMPTPFADFHTGELGATLNDALNLPGLSRSNGLFTEGPQAGLQSTFCFLLEQGEWTFQTIDMRGYAPVAYHTTELVQAFVEAKRRGVVPIPNVLITQEGYMSPISISVLAEISNALKIVDPVYGGINATFRTLANNSMVVTLDLDACLARTGHSSVTYWGNDDALVGWDETLTSVAHDIATNDAPVQWDIKTSSLQSLEEATTMTVWSVCVTAAGYAPASMRVSTNAAEVTIATEATASSSNFAEFCSKEQLTIFTSEAGTSDVNGRITVVSLSMVALDDGEDVSVRGLTLSLVDRLESGHSSHDKDRTEL